ncbi:thiolase C-terminal domain-containing protein [Sphingobium cupriresistens]|uniref:3-ketoacyl-CoA thiolase n=1 Tax=Sphingobium cupriresistens TaxID=1132417 RepID=A0A8G2DWM7_9SPHN|nr:3-ketoacyl-CoA thiolase [Sphingobium cupriresistens]RYM10880.1 3-ketoacyl-CoA thiolase [Sphingobium cupriresistens]
MALSKVGVVATAQTEFRPAWNNAQHIDLISSVVTSVFKGSGLTIDDVDFIIDSGSDVLDGRSISNCGFLGALGAHHKEEARVEEDGLWAALYGVNKIRSGSSSVGLIVAYSKPSESNVDLYWNAQVEPFYQRPVGFGQRAANGILAQRYLAESGLSRRDLADLVAERWAAAATSGKVAIDDLPDADAVLAAEEGAAPLTELMFARPVDGAVAVLIAREDIARRVSRNPAFITGMGTSMDTHSLAAREAGRLSSAATAAATAAAMAYRNAGWASADADIAEISGSSVIGELLAIEALGLAEAGKGLSAARDGKVAINRSGGALPADPIMATGLVRLAEASRQLSQPELFGGGAPRRAIVHGAGGVAMQNNCVFTLEV